MQLLTPFVTVHKPAVKFQVGHGIFSPSYEIRSATYLMVILEAGTMVIVLGSRIGCILFTVNRE